MSYSGAVNAQFALAIQFREGTILPPDTLSMCDYLDTLPWLVSGQSVELKASLRTVIFGMWGIIPCADDIRMLMIYLLYIEYPLSDLLVNLFFIDRVERIRGIYAIRSNRADQKQPSLYYFSIPTQEIYFRCLDDMLTAIKHDYEEHPIFEQSGTVVVDDLATGGIYSLAPCAAQKDPYEL